MTTKRKAQAGSVAATANGPGSGGERTLANLDACVEDARQAGVDGDTGPSDPTQYHQLRGRLETARQKFPPLYQDSVIKPYLQKLDSLGQAGFTQVLLSDPTRQGQAGLMLDIAQAILQKGEGFEERGTDAFLQVCSDLYDGFLSAEDRKAVQPPENAAVPPLVKWGNPDAGPYTWPIDATRTFDVQAAIVNLPPANARRGLLGWAALAHETAGHDILHAYAGLQDQLATAISAALQAEGEELAPLAEYWATRIDETSADIMGILNMGPAAAIGIIGYFRGLNAAFGGAARLRTEGPANDPHPADIVRGYLGASVVRLLGFAQAGAWGDLLEAETDKDLVGPDGEQSPIVLAGTEVAPGLAKRSAATVAATIVQAKMATLENHSLGEIQDWRNLDEGLVAEVRELFSTAGEIPADHTPRIYAAHVVAAAVMEGLAGMSSLSVVFERMRTLLDRMHAHNPSWGPLLVLHPGNIRRHIAYTRSATRAVGLRTANRSPVLV